MRIACGKCHGQFNSAAEFSQHDCAIYGAAPTDGEEEAAARIQAAINEAEEKIYGRESRHE